MVKGERERTWSGLQWNIRISIAEGNSIWKCKPLSTYTWTSAWMGKDRGYAARDWKSPRTHTVLDQIGSWVNHRWPTVSLDCTWGHWRGNSPCSRSRVPTRVGAAHTHSPYIVISTCRSVYGSSPDMKACTAAPITRTPHRHGCECCRKRNWRLLMEEDMLLVRSGTVKCQEKVEKRRRHRHCTLSHKGDGHAVITISFVYVPSQFFHRAPHAPNHPPRRAGKGQSRGERGERGERGRGGKGPTLTHSFPRAHALSLTYKAIAYMQINCTKWQGEITITYIQGHCLHANKLHKVTRRDHYHLHTRPLLTCK